jgi:uncharacterized protein
LTSRHARLLVLVEARQHPGEIAHDRLHLMRVHHWAVKLAPEAGADVDLAGAAALVHDAVPIPKDHADRPLGGEWSARAAGPLLGEVGYDAAAIEAVVEAVRTSSWSRGLAPTGPLGIVLQDADRLDAIGAIGIARCFACGQQMSRPDRPGRLYDPDDPLALAERRLDDRRQAVDHFRAKLLGLAGGMHLPSARDEAQRRHATMLTFLDALAAELSAP